jgi:hypothetical protein
MALAISFISEDTNLYVVAFDGKPKINDIVQEIEDKMRDEAIMSIREWEVGANFELDHYDMNELRKAIDSID